MTRVFVCVLDGCGAGELPDAGEYGDEGSSTLRHVLERVAVPLPNLTALGLGEIVGLPLGAPRSDATYGRLLERGAGKDTTTGHWEMMGVVLERPFPTYPEGFPPEVLEPFEAAIGRGILCNRPASGTGIIDELGDEHVRTGRPIVYTSADSVFQIACHEDVVPVPELYHWCEIARGILQGPHAVGRVIARPFDGRPGTLRPHAAAARLLPRAAGADVPGPAARARRAGGRRRQDRRDLRAARRGRGRPHHRQHRRHRRLHAAPARDGARACCSPTSSTSTRCGATATTWRASRAGSPPWTPRCRTGRPRSHPGDVMMLCADHGVDPTTTSTDHSREYSPLLALGLAGGRYDGAQEDVGATAFARLTGEAPPLAGSVIP